MKMTAATEKRIDELLGELTLEEKVRLCHACSKFSVGGVERLGIDELTMSDGPHGVRAEMERHAWKSLGREEDKCTYLPTGTALAATCNPSLGERFGHVLGSEARARGKDIILGPGVNIIRTPLCGRNFEYMSEDPCLIEKMAPPVVRAIEEEDVAACVKHYALNNQELDRGGTEAMVSRRALHEIYLRGFYAAIIEGGASSVMGAYNRFEGQHCCHNQYLVKDILKGKWGFEGVFLTDWAGCHDTDEAIFHGLDIEMGTNKPYAEYYLADPFLERAKASEAVRAALDDKVRRVLRLMFRVGKPDGEKRSRGAFNTKEHQKVAYDIAAEAMVLLKNEDGFLPISKEKKILVVGEGAMERHAAGGNSSGVAALYEVTPLEGIERAFGKENVVYDSGSFARPFSPIPSHLLEIVEMRAGIHGFVRTAVKDGISTVSYVDEPKLPDAEVDSCTFAGSIRVPENGAYRFCLRAASHAELLLDGKSVLALPSGGGDGEFAAVLAKGDILPITIVLHKPCAFEFGWLTPADTAVSGEERELLAKAKRADAVIYCASLGHRFDTEGYDRPNMALPDRQNETIAKLAAVNPNIAVTITAGSPVTMPWLADVKAILWGWYAGMEGGHAMGDILVGTVVPSGKMPFTLPRAYEDCGVARYGEYKEGPCRYNEDILVGYRAFDYDNMEPLFPFGHGLSYAKFTYSDLRIAVSGERATVTFSVKNEGAVAAKETVQLYVGDPECSVKRAVKELRNLKKVALMAGEEKEVTLALSAKDLSFFDEQTEEFVLEKGEFLVYVGSSSRDIRLQGSFVI